MIEVEVISMPMHDWTLVDQGIYHAFHFNWIAQISQALNDLLPEDYYALPEQRTGIFGPDVLTLQMQIPGGDQHPYRPRNNGTASTATLAKPKSREIGVASEFYLNKQRAVTIRHISGDKLIAVVEIVSPGNKNSKTALNEFVHKVINYFLHGVHVSFVDPFAPSKRDPAGLHAAIWEEFVGPCAGLSASEPLARVSYERAEDTTYYLEPFAVGQTVPPMPVFLLAGEHVEVSLEETYQAAFEAMPARWRDVVAAGK